MPGDFQIPAIAKISTPALQTGVVLAAVPAHAHALPLLPGGNARAHRVDHARHFMSWHARILDPRPPAFHRQHVAVTNSTCLYFDPHLSRARFGNLPLHHFKARSRLRDLRRFHGCCCDCQRCHHSSCRCLWVLKATEAGLPYSATSKITSSSIGIPSGRLATPITSRTASLSAPNTSRNKSDAPSATRGWSKKSPDVAMNTPSSNHPRHAVERSQMLLRRGQHAQSRCARRIPSRLRVQLFPQPPKILRLVIHHREHAAEEKQIARLHRLNVTAKWHSAPPEARCRAPAAALALPAATLRLTIAHVRTVVHVQHLPGDVTGFRQKNNRISDVLRSG